MVKIGFIVEGDTEKILLESRIFQELLAELNLDYIPDIINAEGNGNLLPHNIKEFSDILIGKGANQIFILTDLDEDRCVTETKNRISPLPDHICVVSKKKIESWFLADHTSLKQVIEDNVLQIVNPEGFKEPFEEINRIKVNKRGRGINNKKNLARKMVESGFSIKRSASHPNCSSAKYFLDKLIQLSKKN